MEWCESYNIGIAEIDAQHKKLVHMITRLQTTLTDGNINQEVVNTLRFLVDYIREHFAAEEKIMQDIHFDAFESHRERHRQFTHDVTCFLLDLKKGKRPDPYVLIDFLTDWVGRHIRHEDKRIGRWQAEHVAKG